MTQTEICNLALGWLGVARITSVDDASTAAELCKASWAPTRDLLLSSRAWSFAIRRQKLAPDVTAPPFGFVRQFTIPATVLRVLRCVDEYEEDVIWFREGACILSDEDTINMIALVRVEATADLSVPFCHALAARLAADLAIPLCENRTLQADLWKLFDMKMREAATLDGKQGRSVVLKGPTVAR